MPYGDHGDWELYVWSITVIQHLALETKSRWNFKAFWGLRRSALWQNEDEALYTANKTEPEKVSEEQNVWESSTLPHCCIGENLRIHKIISRAGRSGGNLTRNHEEEYENCPDNSQSTWKNIIYVSGAMNLEDAKNDRESTEATKDDTWKITERSAVDHLQIHNT